jgi:hypothetical protein
MLKSLRGRDRSEDLGLDGRKILKWMSGKLGWRIWFVFIWFRIGTGGGLL